MKIGVIIYPIMLSHKLHKMKKECPHPSCVVSVLRAEICVLVLVFVRSGGKQVVLHGEPCGPASRS